MILSIIVTLPNYDFLNDHSPLSGVKGQGPPALKAIDTSTKDGKWIILQNCHLGKSLLSNLEKLNR
jgi:dynein heavy chain